MSENSTSHQYWLRSGLLTLLEKGSGLVFALGTAVLLLRGLTKEDFAAWGVFLILTYFLEMGRSGLIQNGLVSFLAKHRDNDATAGRIITASLLLNISFSIASNFLLWGILDWVCRTYSVPQLREVLPVYFMTNFVMAFFYHFNFVQQANFEFRGIFWSTFFFRGMLFAWVLTCWLAGWKIHLPELALSMLAGACFGLVGTFWFAERFLNHPLILDFQWVKKLAGYGKYVLGTNLSTMFYKNIDKLTLGNLIGPAAFAVYDAAGKITQLVEVPSFSIAAVVFPQSAARMEKDGSAGVKWLYERSVAAILALILPFVVLTIVFAEPIVWLFAGKQYMESAGILRLTALFGLFMPFAVQFGTVLDSTGRPATNFKYTFFTAVLNLGLSYLLVWKFGLYGAAFATLTSYSISFWLMQRELRKSFGINWLEVFRHLPDMYVSGFLILRRKLLTPFASLRDKLGHAKTQRRKDNFLAMTENELAKIIVNKAYEIHYHLGPGLLESVYEEVLFFELTGAGLFVERQKPLPVYWKEQKMEVGFRADLVVDHKVLIELKSVEAITPMFQKITLNYLKLTGIKLGLLINFNVPLIKDGIQRIVNHL